MPLELVPNDNAREGRPSIWIFSGQSVVWLIGGVAFSIAIYKWFDGMGFDLLVSGGAAVAPLIAVTVFVQVLVNGKAPSHAIDLLLYQLHKAHCRLYLTGVFDRPPQLWTLGKKPKHPSEFSTPRGRGKA